MKIQDVYNFFSLKLNCHVANGSKNKFNEFRGSRVKIDISYIAIGNVFNFGSGYKKLVDKWLLLFNKKSRGW